MEPKSKKNPNQIAKETQTAQSQSSAFLNMYIETKKKESFSIPRVTF